MPSPVRVPATSHHILRALRPTTTEKGKYSKINDIIYSIYLISYSISSSTTTDISPYPTSPDNSPAQETDRYEWPLFSGDHRIKERSMKLTAFSTSTSPTGASRSRFECDECGKTFSTKNNRERHRSNMHRSNRSSPNTINLSASSQGATESAELIPVTFERRKKWDCPYPTCKRKGKGGFSRRDNLIQHCRNVHNDKIPKRQRQS